LHTFLSLKNDTTLRIAIIDLGTNTFNLIVVEPKDDWYELIYSTGSPVKLGEGGMTENLIMPSAFKRGTEALRHFHLLIEEYKCDRVHAFATSMMRSASNGQEFVDSVKRKLGITIEIIDGDREAELIYFGVNGAVPDPGNALIMDMGGGSTEFIVIQNNKMVWRHSFALGISRLFEKFKPVDPISGVDEMRLKARIVKELQPLFEVLKQQPVDHLIGSSGSFTTLAIMTAFENETTAQFDSQTAFPISLEEWAATRSKLMSSTFDERLAMNGVSDFRAKFIVIAALMTQIVIERCGIKTITRSAYNMKEGVIIDILGNNSVA
jgi:exopolyphosphatase/guanosine-5'-triphosphate,3'-diphosphate pyrophosphatase